MQSIADSFSSHSRKRVLHYDHYDRFNNTSFEPRSSERAYPPSAAHPRHHHSAPPPRWSSMPGFEPDAPAARSSPTPPPLTNDPAFDILDWHPAYQSCQRFFLDHAQHESATQALCSLINIRLPFQYFNHPVESSTSSAYAFNFPCAGGSPPNRSRAPNDHGPSAFVSLIPYIKRLIITGFDKPAILHGMFGDDWKRGILPHLDCERRNYLFAAKHEGWGCKKQYDAGSGTGGDESVPFMKPLEEARVAELTAAEQAWSGWLAMEDWMVGPRAPKEDAGSARLPTPGREQRDGTANGAGARRNHADNLPDGVPEAFEEERKESAAAAHTNGHAAAAATGDASEPVLVE